jgi:hypothetical protein
MTVLDMPSLAPGRHRWPSRRVCLMEYVAGLAGERRSDHPHCTDPALAAVARAVNDSVSESTRQDLAAFAPRLVRAHGGGAAATADVLRQCLSSAMRLADADRRQVLVVALLGAERAAAGRVAGWSPDMLSVDAEMVLMDCEDELDPAAQLVRCTRVGRREHAKRAVPAAVEAAVRTIATQAPDPDTALCRLLLDCLTTYEGSIAREAGSSPRHAQLPEGVRTR